MSSARPNTDTRANDGALGIAENALVSVSGVGFDYEDAPILEDVSLTVERGEFVALVGPSGCGKSTILNLISGVLSPRNGTVSANGLSNRSERLGNVSYMQQKDLLLPWRSVAENSRLGLELRGVSSVESGAAVAELADSFGIADVLDSMPWQLSGGMRQRVALLRAVLPDNPVLLLDEPFGALDAITRRSLQQWLLNVLDTDNKAVVLVTHDVEEAILLADRVLVMSSNPGQIIDEVVIDLSDAEASGDLTTAPDFIELKKRILSSLDDQETVR
jgi:ABC-type nitrate/sulfonate/bicarbonate transport system ATPase subunit